MTHNNSQTKKPPITSTSTGFDVYCPNCSSSRVVIFYDPRFTPRLKNKWDELIAKKNFSLENRWEKIKVENQWSSLNKYTEKPNWICRECFDGGVVVEIYHDHK